MFDHTRRHEVGNILRQTTRHLELKAAHPFACINFRFLNSPYLLSSLFNDIRSRATRWIIWASPRLLPKIVLRKQVICRW